MDPDRPPAHYIPTDVPAGNSSTPGTPGAPATEEPDGHNAWELAGMILEVVGGVLGIILLLMGVLAAAGAIPADRLPFQQVERARQWTAEAAVFLRQFMRR